MTKRDIVERLCTAALEAPNYALLREAADEIERLRRPPSEAVEKCARIADEWCERNGWPNGAWGIAAEIRSLLEEKF